MSVLPENTGCTTAVTAVEAMSLAWSWDYLAPEVTNGKHVAASNDYSYRI